MAVPDLKTQIANLAKLQMVDTEIYTLKREKEMIPQEIKLLEAAFEEKKSSLAQAEKVSLDLQKQKKDKEGELAQKEEATKKLQGQLYQLKTNKEYQTMLQQIADSKADGSVIEDKILELMDKFDQSKADIDKEKQKLQQEEKVFNEQKKKVDERLKVIDGRLSQLDAQRNQAASNVAKEILSEYDRILKNRDGLAIVTVKGDSCQGCNMSVPPQVINLIKMYDRIITCEICNRILCIGDETS